VSPLDRAHTTSDFNRNQSDFAEIFGIKKLESLGYRVVLFVCVILRLAVLVEHR